MTKKFIPPTHPQVFDYFVAKEFQANCFDEATLFISFYESKNWYVGKNKMVKWRAAATGWIIRSKKNNKTQSPMHNLTNRDWAEHILPKKQIN